ncbi:hypothetical protein PVNG_05670 [Plasmodium vivax North Korean]|uniref:Variable surface protein Vir18 n=1 Tax=Plasmodium vivax North Korean TaxID=1035514 RepID=A0A0J9WDA9_PLAVI|nr:hypothetical protein PVNG_05670 [Plasmodium vivax North Korean]
MVGVWSGIFGTSSNYDRKYLLPGCSNKYTRYLNEIKQGIDALSRNNLREFCKKCNKIKNNINAKDNELNYCYNKNLISLKLIENHDIKPFIDDCPDIPLCLKKHSSVKKADALKSPIKENCRGKIGYSSKSQSPEKVVPLKQGQRPDHDEVRGQAKVILKAQDGIDSPTSSGEAQEDVSKQIVDRLPSNPVRRETLTQLISVSAHSSDNGSYIPPSVSPQSTSSEQSSASNTSHIDDLSERDSQDIKNDVPGIDRNPLGALFVGDTNVDVKDSYDISDVDEIDCGLYLDIGILNKALGTSDTSDNQIVNSIMKASVPEDQSNLLMNNGDDRGESVTYIEVGHSKSDLNGGFVERSPTHELDDSGYITYNDGIPYQKYIVNGLLPLIAVLLLIILIKFTPLGTIFTKKKRKKQNDMNEKLQRVLQQPSAESEQRRIPFSYSAFEYSP